MKLIPLQRVSMEFQFWITTSFATRNTLIFRRKKLVALLVLLALSEAVIGSEITRESHNNNTSDEVVSLRSERDVKTPTVDNLFSRTDFWVDTSKALRFNLFDYNPSKSLVFVAYGQSNSASYGEKGYLPGENVFMVH